MTEKLPVLAWNPNAPMDEAIDCHGEVGFYLWLECELKLGREVYLRAGSTHGKTETPK